VYSEEQLARRQRENQCLRALYDLRSDGSDENRPGINFDLTLLPEVESSPQQPQSGQAGIRNSPPLPGLAADSDQPVASVSNFLPTQSLLLPPIIGLECLGDAIG
jgi:hypothetical protein